MQETLATGLCIVYKSSNDDSRHTDYRTSLSCASLSGCSNCCVKHDVLPCFTIYILTGTNGNQLITWPHQQSGARTAELERVLAPSWTGLLLYIWRLSTCNPTGVQPEIEPSSRLIPRCSWWKVHHPLCMRKKTPAWAVILWMLSTSSCTQ